MVIGRRVDPDERAVDFRVHSGSFPPDSYFQSREADKPDPLDFDASRGKAAPVLQ